MTAPSRARLLTVSASAERVTLREPEMANTIDRRPGIRLTNRYLIRHGVPWIPVSGEIHYSRVPRRRWAERIRQMKAGGITVIACYVPWLHHVPERGAPHFTGNLDVAAFVDEVRAAGLEMVLRIGPWAHGEMRNGGFPDWVQDAPVRHRTDDPRYLALVREWWGQLGDALDGRCEPSNVLAIQLENELYDQPDHIVTLKRIARESGLSAPLWTATAWGGAQLPETEVLPVYGGYGDGFWVDQDQPWDPSFRQHYFFSAVWDDPGIGADVRGDAAVTAARPSTVFPAATCEIGGGMATAYHRRPRPTALDIAAVAHCKIGNGSAWQGFYMYAGGTNPPGHTQESQATGYPNDVPALSYDFHAPIGEAGDLAPSHAALRRQHAFLDAFGDRMARMPSHLPDERPDGVFDSSTMRWAFRGDDRGGFLFIAWHQPHVPLERYRSARFRVSLGQNDVEFPSRPVDIPPGTLATWPVGVTVGGVAVRWATASVLTEVRGDTPTLVLLAEEGIPVEVAFDPGCTVAAPASEVVQVDNAVVWSPIPRLEPIRVTADGSALDILVLPATVAGAIWVQGSGRTDARRLLLSADELTWDTTGAVRARATRTGASVRAYDPARRAFIDLTMPREDGAAGAHHADRPGAAAAVQPVRAAAPMVPAEYGRLRNRLSAPDAASFNGASGVYALSLPRDAWETDAMLRIEWAGDVAQLLVDGRIVSDRFWDGSPWRVNLRDAGITRDSTLELRVLPLSPHSEVHLPEDAAARLAAASEPLIAVDAVTVERRSSWLENRHSFRST